MPAELSFPTFVIGNPCGNDVVGQASKVMSYPTKTEDRKMAWLQSKGKHRTSQMDFR